jgi:hypothetical protein
MAARFGQRPSAIVGIVDDVLAWDFDTAIHARLAIADAQAEADALADLRARSGQPAGSIAPDQRYETTADLPPEVRRLLN